MGLLILGGALTSYSQSKENHTIAHWRAMADSLHSEGNRAFNKDKNKARENYEQAIYNRLKSLEVHQDSFGLWRSYYNIGKSYWVENKFNEAKKYLDTALVIGVSYQEIEPISVGKTYFDLSNVYESLGDYKRTEECRLQAVNLFEQGEEFKLLAKSLYNLSGLYLYIKEPKKAIAFSEKAITVGNISSREEALNLLNQGTAYMDLKDWETALEYFGRSKALFIRDLDTSNVSFVLNNEALTQLKLGNEEEAKVLLERSLALIKTYYLEETDREYALPLHNLGEVYYKEGKLDSALIYYKESRLNYYPNFKEGLVPIDALPPSLSKIDLLTFHHYEALVLLDLYKERKKQEDLEEALSIFEYCQALIEAMRNGHSSDRSKLFWQAETRPIYEKAIETALLLNREDLAFQFAEYSKAALLLESLNDIEAKEMANLSPYLLDEEKKLHNQIITLETQLGDVLENQDQEAEKKLGVALFEAKEKHREFVRKIEKKHPNYFRAKYDTKTAAIKEIQENLLDKNTALLEFVVGDSLITAFCLSTEGIHSHSIPRTEVLEQQFFSLLEHVSKKGDDHKKYYENAFTLYEQLLGESLTQLPNSVDKLILIPDDFLAYLPFEVLLSEKVDFADRNYKVLPYLFKKYAISYGYSASVLLKNNKDLVVTGGLPTVLGVAPSFDNHPEFRPLKFTQQEVQAVLDLFPGKLLAKNEATKDNLLAEALQYNIVYLATHATAGRQNALDNKVFLSEQGSLALQEVQYFALDSMMTHMIVLSACETGSGKLLKGEGVWSMGRSFATIGIPTITMSLWLVDDKRTKYLMSAYFKGLKDGLDKPKALQGARLAYFADEETDRFHPFYWAAIVSYGNTQAITGAFPWGWGLGLLVLVLLMVGIFKYSR